MKKLILLGLIGILISGCLGSGEGNSKKVAEVGDTVDINYVGRLKSGEVFSTSYEKVAKDESIQKTPYFQLPDEYGPLRFDVGSKIVIQGLEEAVVGMKIGDEKSIEISPEEGYGPIVPSLIRIIPKVEELPNNLNLSTPEFIQIFGKEPEAGEFLKSPNLPNLPWNVMVVDIVEEKKALNPATEKDAATQIVILKHLSEKGVTIQISGESRNTTVLEVNNESFTVLYDYSEYVRLGPMSGKVIGTDDENVTVDLNHPLAGETLIFEIKLERINKGETIKTADEELDGKPGDLVPIMDSPHIDTGDVHLSYNSNPPTSGPHYEQPNPRGIYNAPISKETQVSNLEEGYILVQYNCRGLEQHSCDGLITNLNRTREGYSRIILAPYPDMESVIALTAWGRIDTFDEFNDGRISRFILAYIEIDHRPGEVH